MPLWQLEKLGKMNIQSSWKTGGEAELMFKELEVKSAQAYCSLIKGMAKYLEEAGAIRLFKEMKEKGLKPDLSTCNEIIRLTRYTKTNNKGKSDYIMEILNEIKTNGLVPNLHTFNSCLLTVCSYGADPEAAIFGLNILKEMEMLKIEPSLGTWNSVMAIFYPVSGVGEKTNILAQILDQVEKADLLGGLVWRDVNDGQFFKNAMDKVLNYKKNGHLVHKLHGILMRNNNIKFLNNDSSFNNYFDCYLMALMKFENPEVVMKEWRSLTPLIHSRGTKIMSKMVQYVCNFRCFEYIPDIWSDFVEGKFRGDKDFSIQTVDQLLDLMAHYETPDNDQAKTAIDPLIGQFGTIAELMIKNYPYSEPPQRKLNRTEEVNENKPIYIFEFAWSTKMLSNFFQVCLRANKVDTCAKELDSFLNNRLKFTAELSESCVRALFETFYNERMIEKAVDVLRLSIEWQYSHLVKEFKEKLGSMNLSDSERELVAQVKVGPKKLKK